MNIVGYQINLTLINVVLLHAIMLIGCASTSISDVRSGIGQEYHVLKLPVTEHNVGSEWSKKFGATGEGMLTEDKIKVVKSLKRLDKGTANQVAVGISALSETGITIGSGVGGDMLKQIDLHGLEIVKPIAIGYIPFKPGVVYVAEALKLEGFSIDSDKQLNVQVGVTGNIEPQNQSFGGLQASTSTNSGYGGEGLIIGYILQTVDIKSYSRQEYGPVSLTMNGDRIPVGSANVTAAASYEKVVAGSGKSLPRNLFWACKKAAAKKDDISAAWIITLNITGNDKKTLKIAFPAYPEIEECNEFESIVTTGINSVTDQIERTVVRIDIERSTVNEMLDPQEFRASVTATRESFTVETIPPDS